MFFLFIFFQHTQDIKTKASKMNPLLKSRTQSTEKVEEHDEVKIQVKQVSTLTRQLTMADRFSTPGLRACLIQGKICVQSLTRTCLR